MASISMIQALVRGLIYRIDAQEKGADITYRSVPFEALTLQRAWQRGVTRYLHDHRDFTYGQGHRLILKRQVIIPSLPGTQQGTPETEWQSIMIGLSNEEIPYPEEDKTNE